MKKVLYTLLAVSIIFSACKKEEEDECKNCGTFITFDDTLTDEEIAILEDAGFVGEAQEYCGDELSAYEAELSANGGATTIDYDTYTVTVECQ